MAVLAQQDTQEYHHDEQLSSAVYGAVASPPFVFLDVVNNTICTNIFVTVFTFITLDSDVGFFYFN